MTAYKNIKTDAFAKFAAKREEEQKEIERVGVYGKAEPEDTTLETQKAAGDITTDEPVFDDIAQTIEEDAEELSGQGPEPEKEKTVPAPAKRSRKTPPKSKSRRGDDEVIGHLTLNLPKHIIKGLTAGAVKG